MNYTHLSQPERYQIYALLKVVHSLPTIASTLDRHRSTIHREISRNSGLKGYRPKQAELIAAQRATNSRNGPIIKENIWQTTLIYCHKTTAQSRSHHKYGLAKRRFIDAFILTALTVANFTITYGVKRSVGSAMPAAEIEGGKLWAAGLFPNVLLTSTNA